MSWEIKNTASNDILYQDETSAQDLNLQEMKSEPVNITHPQGELKINQWVFDGVRIIYSDFSFTQPTVLNWQDDAQAITLYYCFKGAVSIGYTGNETVQLKSNQQNIFFGSKANVLIQTEELCFRSFMVQLNKEVFLRIATDGTDALKYFSGHVASNTTSVFSSHNLPVGLHVQQAIDAILSSQYPASLRRIFFLSKVMELLVLQADAHTRSLNNKPGYLRSDYDRERIIFARDYVLQHIDMPPSIPELAKITGINEFKLKKGYKEIFGNSIFGHLAETRLEQARALLQETAKPVSTIAFELGYASLQHLSNAFRKKYGVPPSQLRK